MNMKKTIKLLTVLVLGIVLAVGLTACGAAAEDPIGSDGENTAQGSSEILVAYFSRSGNTQQVARWIVEKTGGEIFRVVTVDPYPEDYRECTEVAREELDNDARPALTETINEEIMASYDTVFVGFPNWWGTMPMAMFTFLEGYDFSGKTIVPFVTHGGSAFGGSLSDLRELCPDAAIAEGLAISGGSVSGSESRVDSWLEGLNLGAA